jgi:hypothetical protein
VIWLTVLLALVNCVCVAGWFHAAATARHYRRELQRGRQIAREAIAAFEQEAREAQADAILLHGEAVKAGMRE